MINKYIYLLILLPALLLYACNSSNDKHGTLARIKKTGIIKAGFVENRPWTDLSGGHYEGVEVRLLKAIAQNTGAGIEWIQGSPRELTDRLKNGSIDVLAGGFSNEEYINGLGRTDVYYRDTLFIGLPGAIMRPQVDKLIVGVLQGTEAAKYVKKTGATPNPVPSLHGYDGPVAGSVAYLRQMELNILTDEILNTYDHFLLVRKGENAWLNHLNAHIGNMHPDIHRWVAEGTFE